MEIVKLGFSSIVVLFAFFGFLWIMGWSEYEDLSVYQCIKRGFFDVVGVIFGLSAVIAFAVLVGWCVMNVIRFMGA